MLKKADLYSEKNMVMSGKQNRRIKNHSLWDVIFVLTMEQEDVCEYKYLQQSGMLEFLNF